MNSQGKRWWRTLMGVCFKSSFSSQMIHFWILLSNTPHAPSSSPTPIPRGRCLGPRWETQLLWATVCKAGSLSAAASSSPGLHGTKWSAAASLLSISARPSLAYQPDSPPTPFSLKKSDLISWDFGVIMLWSIYFLPCELTFGPEESQVLSGINSLGTNSSVKSVWVLGL